MAINEKKDLLGEIRELAQQVSELTNRVTRLEAEVNVLRVENEQLKQNTQQDTNMISTADLALIISLAGINHNRTRLDAGYLEVAKDLIDDIIIQYLARVVLAKYINDRSGEYNAHCWAEDRLKYCDLDNKYKQWHNKIENASASEIVQMIKQLINSATKQNDKSNSTKIK